MRFKRSIQVHPFSESRGGSLSVIQQEEQEQNSTFPSNRGFLYSYFSLNGILFVSDPIDNMVIFLHPVNQSGQSQG